MLYDVSSFSISSEMKMLIFQFDTNFMKTYASIGKKKSNIYILFYVIEVALLISLSY